MKKLIIFVGLLLSLVTPRVFAQELIVKSISLLPDDKSAQEHPVLDRNGDTCALVKIKVENLEGLQFTNKTEYMEKVGIGFNDGMYLLYKPNTSRTLSYYHPSFLPGQLDFKDYGYSSIKGGKTYLVVIGAPAAGIDRSLIVLKVTPDTATVRLENRSIESRAPGIYEFAVGEGSYHYTVEAPNFQPVSGSVTVAKGETRTVSLNLSPMMQAVNVKCNVKKAHLFVDDNDYGPVGNMLLPYGRHKLRVQAGGYLDVNEEVDISENTLQLKYVLKENKDYIYPTPVRIISNSPRVYLNNKEIRNWFSGKEVGIMPGRYMLTDDYDNKKIIKVGREPMEVRF